MFPFVFDDSVYVVAVYACSKTNQRAIEELQRTIVEIETRYKGEISRLRKKLMADIREMELRIDELVRSNNELGKQNKGLGLRVKVQLPLSYVCFVVLYGRCVVPFFHGFVSLTNRRHKMNRLLKSSYLSVVSTCLYIAVIK